jgi:hypothetical protein
VIYRLWICVTGSEKQLGGICLQEDYL